jgi:3-oxoacyl-[acyl-carrier-protein] synthase II
VSKRRVVVTGLGLISPVGNTVADGWKSVRDGVSGIGPIEHFDASGFTTKFAGTIRNFDVGQYLEPKEARRCDPFMHYGIAASIQAMQDSGLAVKESDAHRYGVAMGSGIGGISTIEDNYAKWLEGGPRKISPFFVPGTIINMISGHVSIKYGFTGPNLGIVTACTTSTHCIGLAARLIQSGDADFMLAGGAEFATTPLGLGGFCAARALSTRNDDPKRASRPWDRDRDGFVLSDGAGCIALEEYEHAKARGARIYAEFAGFGMSADAHHITAPAEDGQGAYQCMVNAMPSSRSNRLHQRAWNVDALGRCRRDRRHQASVRRRGEKNPGELYEVDHGPHGRRCRRSRGRVHDSGSARASHPANDQSRQPGPRLRPRLHGQHGAQRQARSGALELVRLRRHERHRRLQTFALTTAGSVST